VRGVCPSVCLSLMHRMTPHSEADLKLVFTVWGHSVQPLPNRYTFLFQICLSFLGCIKCMRCRILLPMCAVYVCPSVHLSVRQSVCHAGVIWCSLCQITLASCCYHHRLSDWIFHGEAKVQKWNPLSPIMGPWKEWCKERKVMQTAKNECPDNWEIRKWKQMAHEIKRLWWKCNERLK